MNNLVIVRYSDGQLAAGWASEIDKNGYYDFQALVNWQMLPLKKSVKRINAECLILGKEENKRHPLEKPRIVPSFDADINDYGQELAISGIPFFSIDDPQRLMVGSSEVMTIKNPYLMYHALLYDFWISLIVKLEEMRIEYPDHVSKRDWLGMQRALSVVLSANTYGMKNVPMEFVKKIVSIWKRIFEKNASYKNWKLLSKISDKHNISPLTLILKTVGYDSVVYILHNPDIGGNPSVKFL